MFHKAFFKDVSEAKIIEMMNDEGFTPKLITDTPNFIYEPHQHPETKYLACMKGSMKITVSGKTYNFTEGDKLLIQGNTTHSGVVSAKGCTYFWSEK